MSRFTGRDKEEVRRDVGRNRCAAAAGVGSRGRAEAKEQRGGQPCRIGAAQRVGAATASPGLLPARPPACWAPQHHSSVVAAHRRPASCHRSFFPPPRQLLHARAGGGVWHHRQGHGPQRRRGGEGAPRCRWPAPCSCCGPGRAPPLLHGGASCAPPTIAPPPGPSPAHPASPLQTQTSMLALQIERRDYEGMLRQSQSQSRGGRSSGAMAGAE